MHINYIEMWINRQEKTPKSDGAYCVFGTKYKGTEYENNCRFTAYWDNEQEVFTDKDGEDLTYINESVRFWFDFEEVPNPV